MNEKDPNSRPEPLEEGIAESNAAKRIRMTGQDVGSDVDCTDLPVDFKSKLSNFWYHHKWKVIVTAFFVFAFSVVILQSVSQQDPDVFILYAGPDYIAVEDNQGFCGIVRELMTEDYNGDGEKKIRLTDIIYSTDAQMEKAKAAAEARGEEYALDVIRNKDNADKFAYEVIGTNAIICILAEDQYRSVVGSNAFVPLSEIFGDTEVQGAVDDFGVRLSETNFYEFYKFARIFPEDAVLALRKPSLFSSAFMSDEELEAIHAYHREIFKKIVDFQFPEGYQPS